MPSFLGNPSALTIVVGTGACLILLIGVLMLGTFGRGVRVGPGGLMRKVVPFLLIEVIVVLLTLAGYNLMQDANWAFLQTVSPQQATIVLFIFLTAANISIFTL